MGELNNDLVFIGRILLAGFLGFLVGWEREATGSPAGDRTHALVAIAAAAFISITASSFPGESGRVMQGIVTGVGFLGAGMILREAGRVHGLTTAAGIWAVAAVGVVVGAGEYLMGIALALLIILVLIKERVPFLRWLGASKGRESDKG